jgi:hypothetical protein
LPKNRVFAGNYQANILKTTSATSFSVVTVCRKAVV